MVGYEDMLCAAVEIIGGLRGAGQSGCQYGAVSLTVELIATLIVRIAGEGVMRDEVARHGAEVFHQ